MAAKADIIKQLRAENINLYHKIQRQKDDAIMKEKRIATLKHNFAKHLHNIQSTADNIKTLFQKELTWNVLSNYSDKQLQSLNRSLERIEEETSDDEYQYSVHRETERY